MITLTFNEAFPDYEAFKVFTDNFKLYTDDIGEAFNKHLYYGLKYRFSNCSLAYETLEEFKAEFGLAYNQYFKQYLIKQDLIDKMYSLKEDDYLLINKSISNLSNNPNYITNDPWELLDFTSVQNRNKSESNKLQAYLLALRSIPDAQINAMLDAFSYLWLDILDNEDIYLYEKE